jgi:hypothetical protein
VLIATARTLENRMANVVVYPPDDGEKWWLQLPQLEVGGLTLQLPPLASLNPCFFCPKLPAAIDSTFPPAQ